MHASAGGTPCATLGGMLNEAGLLGGLMGAESESGTR